jgi:hypothetical protein
VARDTAPQPRVGDAGVRYFCSRNVGKMITSRMLS